jgi:uncharacterized membrane protein
LIQLLRQVLIPLLAFMPLMAEAYVGPGAGLTMLGSLWGLIVAVVFVLFGLLILPYKLMRNKRRKAREQAEQAERAETEVAETEQEKPVDP